MAASSIAVRTEGSLRPDRDAFPRPRPALRVLSRPASVVEPVRIERRPAARLERPVRDAPMSALLRPAPGARRRDLSSLAPLRPPVRDAGAVTEVSCAPMSGRPAVMGAVSERPVLPLAVRRAVAVGRMRLTRRGRAVLVLCLALLLAGAGWLTQSLSAAPPAAAPSPTVVVAPGESLFAIAARIAPHGDPRAVVAGLRTANGLSASDIAQLPAGQTLIVPADLVE